MNYEKAKELKKCYLEKKPGGSLPDMAGTDKEFEAFKCRDKLVDYFNHVPSDFEIDQLRR